MSRTKSALHLTAASVAVNIALAGIKITVGVIGHSYALVADGIESVADIISSLIVYGGLRFSLRPPDKSHPYGHGKAESLAGLIVAASLLAAAGLIAWHSIREILTPHHAPAWFTLPVLLLVVAVKELLHRRVLSAGQDLESTALQGDAWHHRSDALTSLAAALGITIALIGGPGYECADDYAALFACAVIAWNGVRLIKPSLDEVMDAAAPAGLETSVRRTAEAVPGVASTEKCRIRKSGLGYIADLHVIVDGNLTVRQGHDIAHAVKETVCGGGLKIDDLLVHIEPKTEDQPHARS
jgi:cation diffusion facilitator family transporter